MPGARRRSALRPQRLASPAPQRAHKPCPTLTPRFNAVLIVLSLVPVIIFVFWTMPQWEVKDWQASDSKVRLSPLMAWQILLYSGGTARQGLAGLGASP